MEIVRQSVNRSGVSPVTTLTAALVLCAVEMSFAARPLIIDDADPLAFNEFKIEGGAFYEKDIGCKHRDFPFSVAAGAFPNLEIGAGFGGQFEELTEIEEDSGKECINTKNGIGDLFLTAKWQFMDEATWWPRQAVVPTVKFPTTDKDKGLGSGKTDYDLAWIASKSLGEKMGAHINVGYAFIGEPADEDAGDILHYGLALDYQLIDGASCATGPLQWVGEVFAEKELRSGTDNVFMFNTGLRWNPVDTLIMDAAAGTRLAGDAPDLIATAGLTWTFGFTKEESKIGTK